jgi:hypothetical protein
LILADVSPSTGDTSTALFDTPTNTYRGVIVNVTLLIIEIAICFDFLLLLMARLLSSAADPTM